jgi:D-serine deaminase-like pyridoxal phosphate-dependent protein
MPAAAVAQRRAAARTCCWASAGLRGAGLRCHPAHLAHSANALLEHHAVDRARYERELVAALHHRGAQQHALDVHLRRAGGGR